MKTTIITLLSILLLAGGYYALFYEETPNDQNSQSDCTATLDTSDDVEPMPKEKNATTSKDTNLSNMSEEMKTMVRELDEMNADIVDDLREAQKEEQEEAVSDKELEASIKETDAMLAPILEKEGIDSEAIKAEIAQEYVDIQSGKHLPEELKEEVEKTEDTLLEVEQMIDELDIKVEE